MGFVRALGLMSGTSMDGVDVALVDTDGDRGIRLGATGFFPYGDADRALLRAALADAATLADRDDRPGALPAAEAMITRRHAEAVTAFLTTEKIAASSIDLVGFHGQTVLHRPARRLTAQIGDGVALAEHLGIAVAYDFRAADVAAGGQGAPLVPAFHRALVEAANIAGPVVVLNIGGVANLTFIDADGDPIACDTGPGNALLDDFIRERTGEVCDRDGGHAGRGTVHAAALADLLAHPFFALPPPKSLDRNDFSGMRVSGLSIEDGAATLTAFTAATIAGALAQLPRPPALIVACGGGTRNPILMRDLAQRVPCPVKTAEAFGWSADAMEAQAFAYLAVRRLKNLPITFPTTTGVGAPQHGGVLAAP